MLRESKLGGLVLWTLLSGGSSTKTARVQVRRVETVSNRTRFDGDWRVVRLGIHLSEALSRRRTGARGRNKNRN